MLDYFQALAWLRGKGWEKHFDHDAWFSNIAKIEALKVGTEGIRRRA